MLGFAPISDLAVSDIGGDTQFSVALDLELDLTVEIALDDPWSCQSATSASWTCQ